MNLARTDNGYQRITFSKRCLMPRNPHVAVPSTSSCYGHLLSHMPSDFPNMHCIAPVTGTTTLSTATALEPEFCGATRVTGHNRRIPRDVVIMWLRRLRFSGTTRHFFMGLGTRLYGARDKLVRVLTVILIAKRTALCLPVCCLGEKKQSLQLTKPPGSSPLLHQIPASS